MSDIKYLEMAKQRFAWTGGYELIFITDDGGELCAPCVVMEWDECISDAYAGDGWKVEGYDHTGNNDSLMMCDHCGRILQEEWEEGTT